jgi:hypothetical protein
MRLGSSEELLPKQEKDTIKFVCEKNPLIEFGA